MSFTDKKPVALTVFDGEKDKSVARQMSFGVDLSGIRKKYLTNADGTTSRLSTRGGFPEIVTTAITKAPTEENVVSRGYVARINRLVLSGWVSVWYGVIKRVLVGATPQWLKQKKTDQHGPYAVVNHWTAGQKFPDVMAMYKESDDARTKLCINAKPSAYENADGLGGQSIPVVLQNAGYPATGANDADDFHLFGVGETTLTHLAGRAYSGSPSTIYLADELDVGTEAYPKAYFAGVDICRSSGFANYNHWHASVIGALALRFRSVQLAATAPYFVSNAYTNINLPATVYVFPTGSLVTTPNNTWANPVPPNDLGIMEMYSKVGDPTTGYGTYQQEGYYQGNLAEADVSGNDYTLHGVGSYSATIPGGYFGNSLLEFDVDLSAVADIAWRDSIGHYALTNPDGIAASNQNDSPPSYSYQFRSFYESFTTVAAGTALGGYVSSSDSITQSWTSQSVMRASSTITGDVFFAQVMLSGGYDVLNTMNSENWNVFMFQGAACGLATPSVPYYSMINAIKVLSSRDDSHPGDFRNRTYTVEETPVHSTHSLVGTTKDYILFDRENDTYIFIEGTFSGTKDAPFDVLAEFVVKRGGAEIRTELFHFVGGGILIPTELVYDMGYATARYFAPIMPPRVFAPPYCAQGAFKYAAYSEAPDAAPTGFIPAYTSGVFILSIPLALMRSGSTITPPSNAFVFTPINFYSFVGSFGGIASSEGVQDLAEGKIFYIHCADGVFRDWPVEVEASVSGVDHFSECYRV